jgi:putative acyl-CoA dehydrogenase
MSEFFQDAPVLGNQYEDDHLLQSYLRRVVPKDVLKYIEPDLKNFGARMVSDVWEMAQDAENNPPILEQYDAWGKRIDKVVVSRGWKKLREVCAEEGLVSIAYEKKYVEFSRIYQMAKFYLFHPSSAYFTCPTGMTDGAARIMELFANDSLKETVLPRLLSRDPQTFWRAGQWMTERRGGSDLASGIETVARWENGEYRLYGDKSFASGITGDVAITLARIEDKQGNVSSGTRGVSLFYVRAWDDEGSPIGFNINRLKDKLGSKALPTSEITLSGIPAQLLGEKGKGIKNITHMLKLTRLENSCAAVAAFRRGLALARDYSFRRIAFGESLANQPLHLEALANLEIEFTGAFLLTFFLTELVGKEECNCATQEETKVLRLLAPLTKLYTGKQTVIGVSEIVESFGGAGYIEDTDLPRHIRDAQLLPIWEGTTNVLCLDAVRAMVKEKALPDFLDDIIARLNRVSYSELSSSVEKVRGAVKAIQNYVDVQCQEDMDFIEAGSRNFAFSLAKTMGASLLLEHADWSAAKDNDYKYIAIAERWCAQELVSVIHTGEEYRFKSRSIALSKRMLSN